MAACGGDGGGENGAEGRELTEDPLTDKTTFDVEWREDAAIGRESSHRSLRRRTDPRGRVRARSGYRCDRRLPRTVQLAHLGTIGISVVVGLYEVFRCAAFARWRCQSGSTMLRSALVIAIAVDARATYRRVRRRREICDVGSRRTEAFTHGATHDPIPTQGRRMA